MPRLLRIRRLRSLYGRRRVQLALLLFVAAMAALGAFNGLGRIDAVIAQADLEHLDAAPAFERQRWAPLLVQAVLERYRLTSQVGDLWIYVPR